jgi:hypothetical protein
LGSNGETGEGAVLFKKENEPKKFLTLDILSFLMLWPYENIIANFKAKKNRRAFL